MIDLHCHILPGIDDGARDLQTSLEMAQRFVADGVRVVACTPHILPGVYHNTGSDILARIDSLQQQLDHLGIALRLVPGADNHMMPGFVAGLQSGHLLSLAGSRYVLVEPPHHVAPPRLEEFMFSIMVAGYVPILTHPERLTWIEANYPLIERLVEIGVWMQVTGGSLAGAFGRNARYWAERMISEGCVHVVATDAHDIERRRPALGKARDLAARLAGAEEAEHLVHTRPKGVLFNASPSSLPMPRAIGVNVEVGNDVLDSRPGPAAGGSSVLGRLRRLFDQSDRHGAGRVSGRRS